MNFRNVLAASTLALFAIAGHAQAANVNYCNEFRFPFEVKTCSIGAEGNGGYSGTPVKGDRLHTTTPVTPPPPPPPPCDHGDKGGNKGHHGDDHGNKGGDGGGHGHGGRGK